MRVQEKYLLKVVSFDPDQEPEEQHIYLIEVYDFELTANQINFKNCINSKILDEMDKLHLLKRRRKIDHLYFVLTYELRVGDKEFSNDLDFSYEFNYTDSDLIVYDFTYDGDEEYQEPSLSEKTTFFLKQNQFLKKYSENKIFLKQWLELNEFEKECWLNVAYKVNFNQHINESISKVSHIILDGNYIHSESDLYCYIGEQVCGILGYMGYNTSALSNCLTEENLRPICRPLNITWKNFKSSELNFNCLDDLNYLVELLKEDAILNIQI